MAYTHETPSERKAREISDFLNYYRHSGTAEKVDSFNDEQGNLPTRKCIDPLDHIPAIVVPQGKSALEYLHKLDLHGHYKETREHALRCSRCVVALDSILLFEALKHIEEFPHPLQQVLERKKEKGLDRDMYVIKLPSPSSGEFGPKSGRLVFATKFQTPLRTAVPKFQAELQQIPGLEGAFEDFSTPHKKTIYGPGNRIRTTYWQTNATFRNGQNSHISIRSVQRS